MKTDPMKSERKWVLIWAVVIVLLSSVPYLFALAITPSGWHFVGFTRNIDDGGVYLSWMKQAADGHFFIRNLFTNEPQAARQFNILFLVMGYFARLTHIPLIWVYHLFRVGLGIGLIYAVWRFSFMFLDKPEQRRLLVPIIGLAAGFGWLLGEPKPMVSSVDTWQPEATTFQSIYLNPMFVAALLLMVWAMYCLVRIHSTGRTRYGVMGGAALLLLGNVHTYDVITVGAVWAVYVICLMIAQKKILWRTLGLSILAAVIAMPSSIYQYYLYRVDPVFQARANTEALSPQIWSYFGGFGLVLVGAVAGIVIFQMAWGRKERDTAKLLLLVWAAMGFVLPYLPVGQQRKLIMGIQIPMAILCVYAAYALLCRAPARLRGMLFAGLMLVAMGSNVKMIASDCDLLTRNQTPTHYLPFISDWMAESMRYIAENTGVNDVVYAPWQESLLTPGYAGRCVHYGHWSETPDYEGKFKEWMRYARSTDPAFRREVIRKTGATYLVCNYLIPWYMRENGVDYLKEVWRKDDMVIFRVDRNLL